MYLATAKKLTESTRPSALLLLSEYRRVARAAQRQARANPILAPACVAVGVAVMLLSVESGRAAAALLSALPNALVATTLLLMLFGFFVGAAATSASPRAEDLDEQIQTVPASRTAMAVPLTLIPVVVITVAVGSGLSLFMFGMYANMGLEPASMPAAQFGAWAFALGIAGSTTALALRLPRRQWFCGVLTPLMVAAVGWVAADAANAPWWASVAAFLPMGPAGQGVRHALPGLVPGLAPVVALVVTSVALWLWTQERVSPRSAHPRRHVGVFVPRPAPAAIASWLTITLARSRSYSRLLYAPCIGLIAGIVLRTGFPDVAGSMGTLIAAAILLILVEAPLCVSVPFRNASWLLGSSTAPASTVAAGWWIGASLVAAVVGVVGLVPALALTGAPIDFWSLALIPTASFAVAAAGRLVPWEDRSVAMQFLSSCAAALSVIAAIVFQLWSVGRFGDWSGFAVAAAGSGVISYLICLGAETERPA